MEQLKQKAYAKINLSLDVVRRRDDGYHEVKMIMQTVGLYDELTMEKCGQGIHVTVSMGDGFWEKRFRPMKIIWCIRRRS